MKGDTNDDKDLDDKENKLDNEEDEEVILGGERESERDGASVSYEPCRFEYASASSRLEVKSEWLGQSSKWMALVEESEERGYLCVGLSDLDFFSTNPVPLYFV